MDYTVQIQMILETAETNNIIQSSANSPWFYLISKRWLQNYNPSHTLRSECVLKALTKYLVSINSNSKPNNFKTLKRQFMRKRKRHYLKTDQRQRWMWAFILPHSTQGEIWDTLNMRDTFSRLTMIFTQSPQNTNV